MYNQQKHKLFCLLLILMLLVTGCMSSSEQPTAQPAGTLTVHFLNVGQADAALLQCGGQTMLIDGGNRDDSSFLVSYLHKQQIEQIDVMICTHAHEDHVGGLSGPLNAFPVQQVMAPVTAYDSATFNNFLKYVAQQELEIHIPTPGETFTLGDSTVTIIGPVQDSDEPNNTSIVLRIVHGDTSFLFTGDAEGPEEKDIIESGAQVESTVLKVGHHGSQTSSSYHFLREVAPQYGIISVGENNSYGLPHESTLSKLSDADVTVYRTDHAGTIVAVSDGQTVTFTTEKEITPTAPAIAADTQQVQAEQQYIGNVKSKKCHLPSCANLPAENNQISFSSAREAEESGYDPCGNCLGT